MKSIYLSIIYHTYTHIHNRDLILFHAPYVYDIHLSLSFVFTFYHISTLHACPLSSGSSAPFPCACFNMHVGLSMALRRRVTRSSSVVYGRRAYRIAHGETTRLGYNANVPGDNGTDGTRDRKVAVSNA